MPSLATFRRSDRRGSPPRLRNGNAEHVDPTVTRSAIAIDINEKFVAITRERHTALGAVLDVRCSDLATCVLPVGSFELVHAALVFEHVEPGALASKIASWLAPGGVCATVLQLDDGNAPVTPTRYASIAALKNRMNLVSPAEVSRLLEQHGLKSGRSWIIPVKGGRRFHVGLYASTATEGAVER